MRVNSMHVKNFRTLEDIELRFDDCFTSISGRNNAGKTSTIKALQGLLKDKGNTSWWQDREGIEYLTSKTQWTSGEEPIQLTYTLSFSSVEDPGMFQFVLKIASIDNYLEPDFKLKVNLEYDETKTEDVTVYFNEQKLEKFASKEIHTKLSTSTLAMFHNSIEVGITGVLSGGYSRLAQSLLFTSAERNELTLEQEKLKKKIKKLAGKHRTELSDILGKLEEKYEVELTIFDKYLSGHIPLGLNLKDKSVDIPLNEWGTGTQNRTQVMMLILYANKIKLDSADENRITPIIIVEEPESFLHPSAQAEFGRVIRSLSRDLGIQIIISTHSPYMLCQEHPTSNILLDRKVIRKNLRKTEIVAIDDTNWMVPFSQILGLDNDSFAPWHAVIGTGLDCAIFVEGILDKQYLEYISSLNISGLTLPDGCEILAYDGKDALKNGIMLKFVLDKFQRVFVTFDLDALAELERPMKTLGLQRDLDYFAIGINESGRDCMEGLLPQDVVSTVYGSNSKLAMKASSSIAVDRKSAKNSLKQLMLTEFTSRKNWTKTDLNSFRPLFAAINSAFKRPPIMPAK